MIHREIIGIEDNVFFRSHGAPDAIIRWHYHPEYELHYIRDTNGIAHIGDIHIPFRPGHLVLVGPNIPHNWVSNLREGEIAKERSWAVVFEYVLVNKIFDCFGFNSKLKKLIDNSRYCIQFNGNTKNIIEHIGKIRDGNGYARIAAFINLIDAMSEHDNTTLLVSQFSTLDLNINGNETIDNIIGYLYEHIEQKLSLEDVAVKFSMNPNYLSTVFKKKTGFNFVEYINHMRITKSCVLLHTTSMSIREVAVSVGFANISYFNKRFLELKKMTPKEFRCHIQVSNPG